MPDGSTAGGYELLLPDGSSIAELVRTGRRRFIGGSGHLRQPRVCRAGSLGPASGCAKPT
jgi:hypothetical protein